MVAGRRGVGERTEAERQWMGEKYILGRQLTLYGGRWQKGWQEMGDSGVGDGRGYPSDHTLRYAKGRGII